MSVWLEGIDIKVAEAGILELFVQIVDPDLSPPAIINTGTATLRLFEVCPQSSGRAKVFNWTTNAFDDPDDATVAAYSTAMSVLQAGSAVTQDSGLWHKAIADVSGFTEGNQYVMRVTHDTMGEEDARWFQYGGIPKTTQPFEGAVAVTINLKCGLAAAPDQLCIVRTSDELNFRAGGYTDSFGNFECQLDPGGYKVRFGPSSSYSYSNPYTLTVQVQGIYLFTCTAKVQPLRGLTFGKMKGMLYSAFAEYMQTTAGPHFITNDTIEDWIRQGHYRVDGQMRWTRATEDISSTEDVGTYAYSFGDLIELVQVEYITADGTHKRLERVDPDDRLEWLEWGRTGTPSHWTVWNGEVWLMPTPDTTGETIRLYGVGLPEPLDSNSDIPSIPPQYHDLIVNYAMAQAWRHVGKPELEQAVLVKAERTMEEARREPLTDRGDALDVARKDVL